MINTFVSFFLFFRGSDYSLSSIFISLAVSIYTFFLVVEKKNLPYTWLQSCTMSNSRSLSFSLTFCRLCLGVSFSGSKLGFMSLSHSRNLFWSVSRSSHQTRSHRATPRRALVHYLSLAPSSGTRFLCFVSYDLFFFLYIFLLSICFSFVFAVGANVLFALYYWVKILFCLLLFRSKKRFVLFLYCCRQFVFAFFFAFDIIGIRRKNRWKIHLGGVSFSLHVLCNSGEIIFLLSVWILILQTTVLCTMCYLLLLLSTVRTLIAIFLLGISFSCPSVILRFFSCTKQCPTVWPSGRSRLGHWTRSIFSSIRTTYRYKSFLSRSFSRNIRL